MTTRRIGWRSGGILLLLTVALLIAAVAWRVGWMMRSEPHDGAVELTELRVPAEQVISSGLPRDGIPALTDPPTMTPAEVVQLNEVKRGKYLVATDLVVGVAIDGRARAYPIRVLDWHEVVNDTLAGVPLLVTRSPLCGSVAVYRRRVEGDTAVFGSSGLLLQSNPLLYAAGPSHEGSLWAQIDGRPIAGPASAADARLEPLPLSLARWGEWTQRYPATTVLRPDPDRFKRYQRNPYGSYRSRGVPRFPVDPPPPEDGPPPMAPLLILDGGPGGLEPVTYLLPDSVPAPLELELGSVRVRLAGAEPPLSILIEGPRPVRLASWFAWHARDPAGRPLPGSILDPGSASRR